MDKQIIADGKYVATVADIEVCAKITYEFEEGQSVTEVYNLHVGGGCECFRTDMRGLGVAEKQIEAVIKRASECIGNTVTISATTGASGDVQNFVPCSGDGQDREQYPENGEAKSPHDDRA